ncbi:MAG: hypothetical protein ISS69_18715 [Phycisphaerae bacterium]|nr:hypothetical protein [Phycisphaerae bacterium]
MKTAAESKRFRRIRPVMVLVMVVCAMPLQTGAVEPATQPTTVPVETPTTRPFMPDNISEAAIELTHRQKAALSAVRDGQDWRETAFFMMLARTAELVDPEASAKEYSSLESPAVGHLTDYPNRYRAQKIRVTMTVFKSRELVSGSKYWDARPDWPRGAKVWYMAGWHVSEDSTKAEDLVVYSVVDPTKLLGEPSGTTTSGEQFYSDRGRSLELAGVYYKTFRQETIRSNQSDRQVRDYPLVLAYYLKPAKTAAAPTSPTGGLSNTVIVALVLLVIALFIVRRQAKRVKSLPIGTGAAGTVKYTPLRNIEDDDLPPDEQSAEPVDPALVDAVKAFENKRKKADGTDDKS